MQQSVGRCRKVKLYSKSAHVNDLGFVWSGPAPCSWTNCPLPPSLHGPALLITTVFPPGGFAIPCRYALHHPYICPCFWRKHFTHPLAIVLLYKQHSWSSRQVHKGGSLRVLGVCQLVGHRLVMPLLLRPQLVMHWLVMHALERIVQAGLVMLV